MVAEGGCVSVKELREGGGERVKYISRFGAQRKDRKALALSGMERWCTRMRTRAAGRAWWSRTPERAAIARTRFTCLDYGLQRERKSEKPGPREQNKEVPKYSVLFVKTCSDDEDKEFLKDLQ